MNWFSCAIVALFLLASVMDYFTGNQTRAIFYLLSAFININVIFMK